MKQLLATTLFVFVALLQATAADITFTSSCGSDNNFLTTVTLYRNGQQIATSNGIGRIVFTGLSGTYTYKSSTNHTGQVSDGQSVSLDCARLNLILADALGTPLTSSFV